MDFTVGLPIGMLFGIAVGIGSGMASGRSAVCKALEALVENGEIRVTDSDGHELTADQLTATVSEGR